MEYGMCHSTIFFMTVAQGWFWRFTAWCTGNHVLDNSGSYMTNIKSHDIDTPTYPGYDELKITFTQ